MLVLTRKQGEQIAVGENIRITVLAIEGNRVRLGLTAPRDVAILRMELGPPRNADYSLEVERLAPEQLLIHAALAHSPHDC